jgi:hypothetical protein
LIEQDNLRQLVQAKNRFKKKAPMAIDPDADKEPKATTYQDNFKPVKPKRKKKSLASTRVSKLSKLVDPTGFDQAIKKLQIEVKN